MRVLFPGLLDQPVVQFEAALVVLAVVAGRFWKFRGADRALRRLARRPAAAFAASAVLALALHAAVSPLLTRRAPLIHDEFSYILSADTFLAGRAANPPHPLWRSFEAPYVLFSPRYASMYFPAPGLLLAAGKALAGDYLAGPWLAAALLAPLAGWMLAGWVPRRWAVWGALLVALRFGVFGYWANSYWGGAVAAAGGLLLWGAAPRFLRSMRARDAAIAAAGLLLLAASRPFEGAMATAACALACVPLAKTRPRPRALLPGAAVLCAGLAAILWYNASVTGSPLTTPQSAYMRQYGLAIFPWQPAARAPETTNPALVRFFDRMHTSFRDYWTLPGFIASRMVATGRFWGFFLGPLLTLPFLAVPALGRSRKRRWILFAALLTLASLAVTPNFLPHYAAPAFGLLLLAIVESSRVLCAGRGRLAPAVRAIPLVCAAVVLFRVIVPPHATLFEYHWFLTTPGNQARAAVADRFEREPGYHLILVRYAPGHDVFDDWVYNAARIDEARTVWAHDLGAEANARLRTYFASRRAWLVEPDATPPRVAELPK